MARAAGKRKAAKKAAPKPPPRQRQQVPRRRPRRRRRARGVGSFVGIDHINAFSHRIERPLSLAGGSAVAVRGRTGFTLSPGANNSWLILFQPRAFRFPLLIADITGAGPYTWSDYNVTATTFNPTPNEVMVTKGSLRLLDITKQLDLGGQIKVLNMPQPLAASSPLTSGETDDIVDYVRGHPNTKVYSRDLAAEAHQWDSFPTEGVAYQSFSEWSSCDTYTKALGFVGDPAMSTIAILVEPYAQARDFQVTLGLTAYARYSALGALAVQQKPIPVMDHATMMRHTSALNTLGTFAHRAIEGAEAGVRDVARAGTRLLGSAAVQSIAGGLARTSSVLPAIA